jgi:hypothetical protein
MKNLAILSALALAGLATTSSASLVAHYSFDSDFTDGIGSNDLTSAGGGTPLITTVASEVKFGDGALSLDHTANEWLSMTTELSFALTDAWSVSFWAKQSAASLTLNSTGMVMGDSGTTASFIWNTSNSGQVTGGNGTGGLRFRPASGGVGAGNNNYAVGTDTNYNHVAMVADGTGKLTVYYNNGTPMVTAVASGGTIFDINAIGNGYSSNGFTFGGQLDEIYIFDEAIDSTTVNSLFSLNAVPESGVISLVGLGGLLLGLRRRR